MNICRICKNAVGNKTYVAREMMFGTRENFEYFECSNCGCLQIKEVPENLARYYPANYMSFEKKHLPKFFFLKSFFLRRRLRYALGEKDFSGFLLAKVLGPPKLAEWVRKVGLKPDSSILEVGSGIGRQLLRLRRKGFSNLTGVDPFIREDIFYDNGVRIFKKGIENIKGQFDFIMLHHSLEHTPDPLFVLKHTQRLLKPGKYALIRIPVVGYAWKKYGVNWVQLDAPRHLFLHSVESMKILADEAGLRVADVTFDSGSFQFWGSEQYVRDIPLEDERSYWKSPSQSVFSAVDIAAFEEKARELNNNQDGDSAFFYLYKQ
jgi:SAM-dependent methyltransferase